MAKRPHRYSEARMYLAGGSVGLLLIVWSVLAMKDRAGPAITSAQTLVALVPPEAPAAPPPLIPTAAPTATPQPIAPSTSSSGGSTAKPRATAKPNTTASPRPTQQPQTRSRGS